MPVLATSVVADALFLALVGVMFFGLYLLVTRSDRRLVEKLYRTAEATEEAQLAYFSENGYYGTLVDLLAREPELEGMLGGLRDDTLKMGAREKRFRWQHRIASAQFEVSGEPNGTVSLHIELEPWLAKKLGREPELERHTRAEFA